MTTLTTCATSTPASLPHSRADTVDTSPTSHHHNTDNDATANIIFGVFAVVLAAVGILLAYLQIRSLKHKRHGQDKSDKERSVPMTPVVQLLET